MPCQQMHGQGTAKHTDSTHVYHACCSAATDFATYEKLQDCLVDCVDQLSQKLPRHTSHQDGFVWKDFVYGVTHVASCSIDM